MAKVTKKQLREEAERVFGRGTWANSREANDYIPGWFEAFAYVRTELPGVAALSAHAPTEQGARAKPLAMLQSLRPARRRS